jgi:phytoene desaturase
VKKHVVVIGAGFGGLSAACYLARAGYRVSVFEKNSQPGGRAYVVKSKGFTFDAGPSWYMMPDVFNDFFADFGHKTSDFYRLKKLNPSYKVFTDDQAFDVHSAPDVHALFEAISSEDADGLRRLLAKTAKEYESVRSNILEKPFVSKREALSPQVLKMLLNGERLASYHKRVNKHVKDRRLQQILEFMTVFMGGSPKNIPGMYSLLAHVDMGLGIWYPMGGFGAVAKGFESLAKSLGVSIHYNIPVQNIIESAGKVVAVQTGDVQVQVDAVVANADYHHVDSQLLKTPNLRPEQWSKKVLAPSGMIALLGVNKRLPRLQHHNLFFDTDWDAHFREVFNKKVWSDDPLFYLCAPAKTDTAVAPKNYENLFVLAPMAAGLHPTPAQQQSTLKNIVARIEKQTKTSVMPHIVTQQILAHEYFEQTFNAYQGTAFGLAHTLFQSAVFRPSLQHKKLNNMFYTGQFTNPGTGVPMVVLSGKISAGLVQKTI